MKYKVYMPKHKLFGDLVNRVVDWQAVDAREEADGEVEEVQRLAEISRCSFIDGRVTERLICSDCTSEIDLTEHFCIFSRIPFTSRIKFNRKISEYCLGIPQHKAIMIKSG